jgi:hypothetical protein
MIEITTKMEKYAIPILAIKRFCMKNKGAGIKIKYHILKVKFLG